MLFFDHNIKKSSRIFYAGIAYVICPTLTQAAFVYHGGKTCYNLAKAAYVATRISKEFNFKNDFNKGVN